MIESNKTRSKTTQACYRIAGLWCLISFPEEQDFHVLLPSCVPFKAEPQEATPCACRIEVKYGKCLEMLSGFRILSEVDGVLGDKLVLFQSDSAYYAIVQFGDYECQMVSNKDFSTSDVYLPIDKGPVSEALNSFFMLAFSQAAIFHQALLIHASVVEKEGFGYAFLGKSGTGKSTHSSLWLRYIPGTSLLNDDNPAIRVETDGKVNIYGTPWSGKTLCYINRGVELKALVRLQQAQNNRFTHLDGMHALLAVLPSCSSFRWDDCMYSLFCDLLEKIVARVQISTLECKPNQDAASMCYEEITRITYSIDE